jgi:hypothetical protein
MDDRTDIWREGKWVDLWSLVHLLSGISLGFGMYLLHFGTEASILLAVISLTAYEMWEALVQIEEAPTNRFTDVVFGMLGFLPSFLILSPELSSSSFILTSGLVLTLNVTLSIAGWHASQKAATLKKRMRERLARQKKKFLKKGLAHRDI